MNFSQMNESMPGLSADAMEQARSRWNAVAKPIGSLGLLEDAVVRIAGITGSADVSLGKRLVVAMCADNGVVVEGVTQAGQDVTGVVAANMARGVSSVCRMGRIAHADVLPIDVGMAAPQPGVLDRHVARGTANMAHGPAMTRSQAHRCIQVGIDAVADAVRDGYRIILTGEMGIGNTTTSSAVASVLLGVSPAQVTGRGAGLSDAGLARKVAAIESAIRVNGPDSADAIDVVAKVGGFDIAALAGVFIGGALHRVPVVVDGFISAVAALVAVRLCPACAVCVMPSHASAEPAARMVLGELGIVPLISAGMRLGEGTGAVCVLPLLDMALSVYDGLSFDAIGIDAYEVLPS